MTCGSLRRLGRRGATLIELVLAIAIAGVMAGAVSVAVGVLGRESGAVGQARRLEALIQLASDQAVQLGRPIGLVAARSAYHFVERDDSGWRALTSDPLLRARDLPPGVRVAADFPARDPADPILVLYPDGTTEPVGFRLISAEGPHASIEVDAFGGVTVATSTERR